MLVVPRLYHLYTSHKDHELHRSCASFAREPVSSVELPHARLLDDTRALDHAGSDIMLLLHQTGSVKVGEVVRYEHDISRAGYMLTLLGIL